MIENDPIDPAALIARVAGPDCGAVSVFIGTARQASGGRRVVALEYDVYDTLAEETCRAIAAEIEREFVPCRIAIAHRRGRLVPGEIAVVVAAAAPHRAAAIEACRQGIERVKARAPIWKKEHYEEGAAWVRGHSLGGEEP